MRSRVLAGAALALALTCPALAHAASGSEVKNAKETAVSYVRSQQSSSGAFTAFGGEWTLSALAAAGVAAAEVKTSETATDARSYYRSLVGNPATWPGGSEPPVTDYETAALAAYAAGIDPGRVSADQNLIAQVIARYQLARPGYYGEPGLLNGTVFGLLTLADARTTAGRQRVPASLLAPSVEAVRANQHSDGGWSYTTAAGSKEALEAPAEAEFTGATMAALCGAGVSPSDPAIVDAEHFLAADLQAETAGTGAFAAEFGPNTDTNAWAVEGLNACGLQAQSAALTSARGKTPLDFIISQQLAGGGFRYEPAEAGANLYSSQDALRALAKGGFTAKPPLPKNGAPRWSYQATFTAGVRAQVSVLVAGTPVHPCAVSVLPSATTVSLAEVLETAQRAATPAGCVTELGPASGTGPIVSVNGQTPPAGGSWRVSIDGGTEKEARRSTRVGLGATVYLWPS